MTTDQVLAYHDRSKHRPGRYAASLGYLDWDTQPNPFRIYDGAPLHPLARDPLTRGPTWPALFTARPPADLTAAAVATLLLHSLALSAWKQQNTSRWSLRVNPSSGNLHPTEAYLLAPPIQGLSREPALYHYSPLLHALERRTTMPAALWSSLTADLPEHSLLVGLTSIPWREAWKYGERSFRYCQHDLGHAVAALAFAAALLGWHVHELPGPGDDALATLLGLPAPTGPEPELPETLLLISPARHLSRETARWTPPAPALAFFAAAPLAGTANELSQSHHPWPLLATIAEATRRPPGRADPPPLHTPTAPPTDEHDAAALIRRRRSAVAMDGRTGITRAAFYDLLQRTAPGDLPFTALAGPTRVDLAIFVHRVQDLEPGLYLQLRDHERLTRWRSVTTPEFAWTPAPDLPAGLSLHLLRAGDARRTAAAIACGQDIAADGCFALAMLADFTALADGPWHYRRLFWETGAIGQALYLGAEALGISATGIGCFFDDPMHDLLGLTTRELQSLYHFTIGGRVDDDRLRTLDPYHHLDRL